MTGLPGALLGAAEIRTVARQLHLVPSRALGQNFVIDPNTIRRIVAAAGLASTDVVLEVGPGVGSLTLGLLDAASRVVAVEVDHRLAAVLPDVVATHRPARVADLQVVAADARRLASLSGPPPTALVANLPYNVAVPVLLHLLERLPSLRQGLVMVQSEVADRLTAVPGNRVYGAPTIKLAWYAAARRVGSVPRQVFWPVPRVDSGLVAFTRRPAPAGAGREAVFTVLDAAFGQRRKTLRGALARLAGSPAAASRWLAAAGIDASARGETLELADFVRLAAARPG